MYKPTVITMQDNKMVYHLVYPFCMSPSSRAVTFEHHFRCPRFKVMLGVIVLGWV